MRERGRERESEGEVRREEREERREKREKRAARAHNTYRVGRQLQMRLKHWIQFRFKDGLKRTKASERAEACPTSRKPRGVSERG